MSHEKGQARVQSSILVSGGSVLPLCAICLGDGPGSESLASHPSTAQDSLASVLLPEPAQAGTAAVLVAALRARIARTVKGLLAAGEYNEHDYYHGVYLGLMEYYLGIKALLSPPDLMVL
ncbi:unnamed protein product [Clonostachys solani]|uniref:Uncharacterized protein n=1 Tax=Clonostachys solani TaxID=160281 RepID=A0A9P0EGC0_9HYPO|nr:unnamed protein product [Clonostachys solani]